MPAGFEVFVVASVVVLVASTVQGCIGFGANLVAAPILAAFDTDLVPGPLFVSSVALTALTALSERDEVDWPAVGWTSLGRFPGIAVGAVVLASVSDTSLQVVVAISILAVAVASIADLHPPAGRRTLMGAGLLSGFGATTSAIGGPPVAMVLHRHGGPALRSTMAVFFLVGAVFTLPAMALAGRLDGAAVVTGLALVPAVALGLALSVPLRPRLDAGRLRPAVQAVSVVASVALLVRALG